MSKTTQFNYEKGDRQPDAAYLTAIADVGVDVMYLLKGSRTLNSDIASEESVLLNNYRSTAPNTQEVLFELLETLKQKHAGVAEAVVEYVPQQSTASISEMVKTDSPDVALLKKVIERVERILIDEQITLSADQKARVIVACMHASLKEGGESATHIATAIRAVI